jgi:hypothetical protein
MAPGGGLFLAVVGAGMVLGALFPNKRDSMLICGFILATAALVIFGGRVMARFGTPTRLQFWFLFGSRARNRIIPFWLAEIPKGRRTLSAIS